MKALLSTVFIVITLFGYSQRKNKTLYDFSRVIPPEDLKFDMVILKDALKKAHAGLLWYQSKEDFEKRYEKIIASLQNGKTELEFYQLLAPFISKIGCGHTSAWCSNDCYNHIVKNYKFLPFDIKLVNERIYVYKNLSDNNELKHGLEVLSIDNKNTKDIIEDMYLYFSSDGFNKTSKQLDIEEDFLWQYGIMYGSKESFELKCKTLSGEEVNLTVKGNYVRKLDDISSKRSPSQENTNEMFEYSSIDSLNTAIMKVKTFESRKCKKFYRKCFRDINEKKISNLIIDLRGNDGGNDNYAALLYSYIAKDNFFYLDKLESVVKNPKDSIFSYGEKPVILRFYSLLFKEQNDGNFIVRNYVHKTLRDKPFKPKKGSFSGEVYLLLDGKSFSATSEFAAICNDNKRAISIGQETGGGYCGNTSGRNFYLTLPKSGITICIPILKFYSHLSKKYYGVGVIPEHNITPTPAEAMSNKDVEVEYTINLITKHLKIN